MNSGRLLSNPAARGQVAAAAALAGWHGGRIANGWWRHGDGGYGWVGPLFWPFAYHDIYDYTIWDDGIGFWAYGYGDIYAGIFAPYGQDDLAGYTAPGPSGRRHRRVPPLQQLCGMTAAKLPASPSIRSSGRYSRLRRSAQHWTIWPTHRSRPPGLSGRRVRRRRRQRHRPAWLPCRSVSRR